MTPLTDSRSTGERLDVRPAARVPLSQVLKDLGAVKTNGTRTDMTIPQASGHTDSHIRLQHTDSYQFRLCVYALMSERHCSHAR